MEKIRQIALVATAALLPGMARAQLVISETLTGTSASQQWTSLNGACLTAGTNPVYDASTNTIPGCTGLSYYKGKTLVGGVNGTLTTQPDPSGQGALRLTNGDTLQNGSNGNDSNGAVVSNFTFPTNQGVQVTFTTVTYGGNGYGNGRGQASGADGIGFFLSDGTQPPTVGGLGGSLGYSCSNQTRTKTNNNKTVYIGNDGVQGGYIGIGIDEYGNFANGSDNSNSGAGAAAPGRISVRGSGNTTWAYLNSISPNYYPSLGPDGMTQSQANALIRACSKGQYRNNNGSTVSLPYNYNYIAGDDLPQGTTIYSQQATSSTTPNKPVRSKATPITYSISITQDGILNMSYAVNGGVANSVIKDQSITATNGPLPKSFRFGFSAGTGSGSNVHEITCFKAAQIGQSSSSAGTNIPQLGRVIDGTQLYLAYYHPKNWWGELTAQTIGPDAKTGKLVINSTANWNASCALTGGACPAMGSSATVTAQGPASRSILTWNGTNGVPFQWGNLTKAQQTALTSGDTSATSARLQYLRGDRSKEVGAGGTFRTRDSVLGDIINSSPTWVGAPAAPYNGPWVDALYPKATAAEPKDSYAAFKKTYGQRLNVVYVGANDGMLHGFRAGSFDTKGNFVNDATTPNDGQEALAYMPAAVVNTVHSTSTGSKLDFASPSYTHNLYVDATPGTGELYYNGAWHTWLVGGLGGGTNTGGPIADNTSTGTGAIYALDITDPSTFSEGNASSLVIGEWTAASISCTNVANCGNNLGNTYGTPVVRRLHNGSWAVLFGNGLNSANGTAGIYIMLVDAKGGTSFRYLDTGSGSTTNKNGIAYVTAADLDGDHITDYVYAGDLFGNLWRFDLTSQDPASWGVSSTPLFTTATGQPITSQVAVASVPGSGSGGNPRVLIAFGTGQLMPATLTSPAVPAKGAQALYGIWDWNMGAWNAMAPATAQYASLTAPQTVAASSLLKQSITKDIPATDTTMAERLISNQKVCWKGSTDCATNDQYGWTLPLPTAQNEQVIYNPKLQSGVLNINTVVPAVQNVLSCSSTPASGYSYGLSVATGGATPSPYFYDANGNYLVAGGIGVSAVGMSGTGTSTFVNINGKVYAVMQTADGTPKFIQINPAATGVGSRVNWVKLR